MASPGEFPFDVRQQLFLSQLDADGLGLEIGPSYSPVVPKRSGMNIRVADHAGASELKEKYRGAPGVNIDNIEDVDYVLGAGGLLEAIAERGVFDFIIASHVIEHVPDLVKFLSDCEKLLKPTGVLALAVPDKRSCFDVLAPLSSTGDVLDSFGQDGQKLQLGTVFDSVVNRSRLNGEIAWKLGSAGILDPDSSFEHFNYIREKSQEQYVDIHRWFFVPSSFRLILSDLRNLELIGLNEKAFLTTTGIEFYCFLSASSPRVQFNRQVLAFQALKEQCQIAANGHELDGHLYLKDEVEESHGEKSSFKWSLGSLIRNWISGAG